MAKFLFVDDDEDYLSSLREWFELEFEGRTDAAFVQCKSLDEARRAVQEHQPSVLVIDNALTGGGNEGLVITPEFGGKVYLLSGSELAGECEEFGIELIDKADALPRLRAVVTVN